MRKSTAGWWLISQANRATSSSSPVDVAVDSSSDDYEQV
jgi:hypothetical protein